MSKFQLNLVDNVGTIPDNEIEYCNAKEFFAQMEEANQRLQKSLNDCLNIGEGAL